MGTTATLEALLKRDRLLVVAALFCVITFSWGYILAGAGSGMTALEMTAMSRPADLSDGASANVRVMQAAAWGTGYAVLMFFMWWTMMLGMMLPSATPMILLYAKLMRREKEKGAPYVFTGIFLLGYLVAWAGFSLVAVAAQWALGESGLLSGMMVGTSVPLGTGLLIAAGLWQLTPLKHACLRHCRSPIGFFSQHWRNGSLGAFHMGVAHGAFCLGCCWVLMALLFYGGVMNLYWIIGLAIFVLIEKLIPAGDRIGQLTGLALIVWGGVLLFGLP